MLEEVASDTRRQTGCVVVDNKRIAIVVQQLSDEIHKTIGVSLHRFLRELLTLCVVLL